MTASRTVLGLARLLLATGGVGFAVAVVWWYLFFEQMLGSSVKQASQCFYRTTESCSVGNAVGSVVGGIPAYSPILLWAAVGLAVLGLVLIGHGPERTRGTTR